MYLYRKLNVSIDEVFNLIGPGHQSPIALQFSFSEQYFHYLLTNFVIPTNEFYKLPASSILVQCRLWIMPFFKQTGH